MAIKIRCPNPACGKPGSVTPELAGQEVRCSFCGVGFTAPTTSTVAKTQMAPRAAATILGKDLPAFGPADAAPVGGPTTMPQRIGRFQVRAILGRGAFGVVYRAYDADLDREVALKVPHADILAKPKALARFLDEGKAAARLHHPHIVPVHEVCAIGGHYYLVSAFIQGRTLAEVLGSGAMPVPEVVHIIAALADALSHAHGEGIIHRDVKPANVMVDAHGHPYLMDFGIAHRPDPGRNLTKLGDVLGTPGYLSPEQAEGKPTTAASDQYSLGVMLYELLCGQKPFAGPPKVVLYHTSNTAPPSLRGFNAAVPPKLEAICSKAMAKLPADRYGSCRELVEELRRYERDAAGPDKPQALGRPYLVAGAAAVVAGVFAVVLLVGIIAFNSFKPADNGGQGVGDNTPQKQDGVAKNEKNLVEPGLGDERDKQLKLILADAQKDWQDQKFGDAKKKIDQAAILKPGDPAVEKARQDLTRATDDRFAQLLKESRKDWDNKDFDQATTKIDEAEKLKPADPAIDEARKGQKVAWENFFAQLLKEARQDSEVRKFDEAKNKIDQAERMKRADPAIAKAWKDLEAEKRRPTVEIVRAEPAEPKELDTLTLQLGGKDKAGGAVTYEFPVNDQRAWQPAPEGRIVLPDLEPGLLALEVRACDKLKVVSRPIAKNWAIKALDRWGHDTGQQVLYLKHEGLVSSVAFSPDGTRIVSGGFNRIVKAWDARNGEIKLLPPFPTARQLIFGDLHRYDNMGANAETTSFAYSPDGKRMVTTRRDGTAAVRDAQTHEVIGTFRMAEAGGKQPGIKVGPKKAPQTFFHCVAFSHDGERLASGDTGGRVVVWDPRTGKVIFTLEGHTGTVNAVAFSRDKLRIVSGSRDMTLKIWERETGNLVATLKEHANEVYSVAFSPDGKRIVSGSADKTARVWNLENGKYTTLKGHTDQVHSVAVSPDGKRIASGSFDGTIKFWDAQTGKETLTINGHKGKVFTVAFSPDGKHLASGGDDASVRVWAGMPRKKETDKVFAAFQAATQEANAAFQAAQEGTSPTNYRDAYAKFKNARKILADAQAAADKDSVPADWLKKLEGARAQADKSVKKQSPA